MREGIRSRVYVSDFHDNEVSHVIVFFVVASTVRSEKL